MRYASVVIAAPLDKAFDYEIPERWRGRVQVGARLLVPFGPRRLAGYCAGLKEAPDFPRVKPILDLLDPEPLFTPALLELARRIARETLCSWGEALEAMLPAGVRAGALPETRVMAALAVPADRALALAAERDRKAPRQAKILRALADAGAPVPVARLGGAAGPAARALAAAGFVRLEAVEAAPEALLVEDVPRARAPILTQSQEEALAAIAPCVDPPRHAVFLLQGVTGSGKTEVYLRAIHRAVEAGRQAIVLVPEIALTPQTVRRFKERFDAVAILHSHLTEGQRDREWRRLRAGEAQVVVGARSAVFAPVPRLGLIVIDEEHEPSFKQQSKPRYHAREAAVWRGQIEGVPILMGSATPSLESFEAARAGRVRRVVLPDRIGEAALPPVSVLDLAEEARQQKGFHLLSRPLVHALETAVAAGQQAILFLNRRGFATWVHCPRCGETIRCIRCAVSLIYHRAAGRLCCHYCLYTIPLPSECPVCRFPQMRLFGAGTERVAEEAREKIPRATVARMDSDTTRGRDAHRAILDRFRDGRVDILVGTQMIAKGLDFPRVTVVGVVCADTALNLPDFRAGERTFQLIVQVAGRAGRGAAGGRVFVQSYRPRHPSVLCAATHDYETFAREELAVRRQMRYPPFARFVRILVSGRVEPPVKETAQAIRDWAAARAPATDPPVDIIGPAPAPLSRLEGRWRWHLLVKTPPGADVGWLSGHPPAKGGTRVDLDVDPLSLL